VNISRSVAGALLAGCLALSGCASIGPSTVRRDRFDYVVAISDSYKRQTLLNLVKTRYADVPVYMEIDSVINQYAIEGELGFEFAPSSNVDNLLLGNGKYTDRPTITYSPLTGERYTRSLLKPVPLSGVFLLLQAGYPADAIMRVCVQSLNGLDNRRSGALVARDADPRFEEAIAQMRALQLRGALYFQVEPSTEKLDIRMGLRPARDAPTAEQAAQLRRLLGLDATATEYPVVFGSQAKNRASLAVMSRSMTQVMVDYAADIDVPAVDVEEGRVVPTRGGPEAARLIRVHAGEDPPADAHAAVRYRDRWFWIDDRDLRSKTSLQFLMTLFAFTERGTQGSSAPVITVPTY